MIKCNIVKKAQVYKRDKNTCKLYLVEKMVNKESDLVSMCRHINKFFMCHLLLD